MLTTQARATGSPAASRAGLRRLRREGLDQLERRAQVRADVPVPALPGRGRDGVVLEDRGVVDQHGQRPAERRRRPPAPAPPSPSRSSRSASSTAAARPPPRELLRQRLGRVAAGVAVDRHVGAARGQPPHHRRADALRAAGDERRRPLMLRRARQRQSGRVAGLRPAAEHVGAAVGALARRLASPASPAGLRPIAAAAARQQPSDDDHQHEQRGGRRRTIIAPAARSAPRARAPRPRRAPRRRRAGRGGGRAAAAARSPRSAASRRRGARITGTRWPMPSASPTSTPACADPDLAGEEVVAGQPRAAPRS